ncbi:CKLF-like MARVEL transmembrane domain-containing protein 6 [Suncus etruscus]|uniref:CKLF-like MARVEL transmembrane domain-containing protein 6 n=1 Tax=Suncus etruscus TaxID=109475 RepID=UPI002110C2C9|nr:CKLF-like MARVEL transmembrane domain-containing protein 6 [Suncus etruscus]
MENGAVYGPTTEEAPGPGRAPRRLPAACCSLHRLPRPRRALKLAALVLSLLAFICEEVVSQCTMCGGLYFFEFVSCSAFLLSLLILVVYCTSVYDKVESPKVRLSDFYITATTGAVFFLASVIFAFTQDQTPAEYAAVVFGFLGSFVFIADAVVMFISNRREDKLNKPEAAPKATLTEPLNA